MPLLRRTAASDWEPLKSLPPQQTICTRHKELVLVQSLLIGRFCSGTSVAVQRVFDSCDFSHCFFRTSTGQCGKPLLHPPFSHSCIVAQIDREDHTFALLPCYKVLPYPSLSLTHSPPPICRLHHRQLSRPRTTRFRHTQPSHPTPPIAEQSHTPTSQARTPHPSGPPMSQKSSSSSSSSSSVLVVYDLVDMTAPDAKRPPYAKRLPSTTHITLAEFKEKIFARKGDFR